MDSAKNNNQHSASYNSSSKQKIQLFGQIYLPQNLAQQQNGGCWGEKQCCQLLKLNISIPFRFYVKSSLVNLDDHNYHFNILISIDFDFIHSLQLFRA